MCLRLFCVDTSSFVFYVCMYTLRDQRPTQDRETERHKKPRQNEDVAAVGARYEHRRGGSHARKGAARR